MSQDQLQTMLDKYLAAYSDQDAVGCAATFTPDGALFSPFGPSVKGRDAIANAHREWFKANEQNKQFNVMEFHQTGELGHCLLSWSAQVPVESRTGEYTNESGISLCILDFSSGEALISRLALVPDTD